MSKPITEASVVYHTGVFTPAKTTGLCGVGALGAVLLTLGILGYFFAHQIPLPAVGTAMGVGGGLLLLDGVILVGYVKKHLEIKNSLEEMLENQGDPVHWKIYDQPVNKLADYGVRTLYALKSNIIHHFPNDEAMQAYRTSIKERCGYVAPQ